MLGRATLDRPSLSADTLNRAPPALVIPGTESLSADPKEREMTSPTDTLQRADQLTVVHHDDTESRFTDVSYSLSRAGLRIITATGDEREFPGHDILTTHVTFAHEPLAA